MAFSTFRYDSVPQIQLAKLYENAEVNNQWPYSSNSVFFPTSGGKLPTIELKVVELVYKERFDVDKQTVGKNLGPTSPMSYLMNVEWMSNSEFISTWTNSNQSSILYDRCFVKQDEEFVGCEQVIKETSQRDSCYLPIQVCYTGGKSLF